MTNIMNPQQTYEGELLKVGTTAERDAMTNAGAAGTLSIPAGWQFFDTDLTRPLWWNGDSGFLLADGTVPAGGIA